VERGPIAFVHVTSWRPHVSKHLRASEPILKDGFMGRSHPRGRLTALAASMANIPPPPVTPAVAPGVPGCVVSADERGDRWHTSVSSRKSSATTPTVVEARADATHRPGHRPLPRSSPRCALCSASWTTPPVLLAQGEHVQCSGLQGPRCPSSGGCPRRVGTAVRSPRLIHL
jgi:hypothetical protein